MQQISLFKQCFQSLFHIRSRNKVHRSCNCLCTVKITASHEGFIIISMQQISADFQLLPELRISHFGNIGIAVVLLVPGSVVVHCLLQCRGNTNIVDDKTALLVPEDTIYPGDRLHEVVAGHRFIYVHRCQRRHIKAGKPHIHHDNDLQRTGIIFKLLGKFFFITFIADDFAPLFRILVALGHHNSDLFCPARTKLQNALINLHRYSAGVGNDHRLARKKIRAVILVMIQDIKDQGINRLGISENRFHLAKHLLALPDHSLICLAGSCHEVIFLVNLLQSLLIQMQFHDTAFIINRAGCPILDSLRHIINVDIVTENSTGIMIPGGNRCAGKPDKGCIRQAVTNDAGSADDPSGFLFTLFVRYHLDPFSQSVLTAVRFVCHNDDIPTFRERCIRLLKFLHSCEDNAVCSSLPKPGHQMLPALCVDRHLPQKIFASCKLREELIIQVVPVSNHNNCRTVKRLLEQMCIEHHRK